MLTVEIDPAEAGFEAERLNRIDRHYQRYVDEGKLAGFLALIARDGQLVHIAKGGCATSRRSCRSSSTRSSASTR